MRKVLAVAVLAMAMSLAGCNEVDPAKVVDGIKQSCGILVVAASVADIVRKDPTMSVLWNRQLDLHRVQGGPGERQARRRPDRASDFRCDRERRAGEGRAAVEMRWPRTATAASW